MSKPSYKIFKFTLDIEDEQVLRAPKIVKFLSVQEQCGQLCLWCVVDVGEPDETWKRIIRIVGTGHPFEDFEHCTYIGTAQTHQGKLVWHVFYK